MRSTTKENRENSLLQRKVFVGMSGGVDSSVAAALLKERGFDVAGVHIKMWSDPDIPCTFKEDRYDAMRAAAHLGIPFETWDLTAEYKQAVVKYMIAEYAVGRTPNPDVMCNREIKFGVFLRRALAEGTDFIATGHYARRSPSGFEKHQKCPPSISDSVELLARSDPPASGSGHRGRSEFKSFQNHSACYKSLKGVDENKDQSYFLWTLTQAQLKHCLFPIGEYTKPEVRAMARKLGLPNADKPDSQGICFIGEIDMAAFLKKYIPSRRGSVLTTSGKKIGEHGGLSFSTIGQRRGIEIGGGPSPRRSGLWPREGGIPYYVTEKNFERNELVVAEGPYDAKLFSDELVVTDVNWISGTVPKLPSRCEARIRYRQPLQQCHILKILLQRRTFARGECASGARLGRKNSPPPGGFKIKFDEPQRAITPGQSIVFYSGDEMLGGGVIT